MDFLAPSGRQVVEIGPGGGVLTDLLIASGAVVRAVEMDLEWACVLRQRGMGERLRIVVGDALRIAWERLPPGSLVTGNLPYQISTALIERLLPLHGIVPRSCFLVQLEVAERLVAQPGSGAYGSLSVMTSLLSRPRFLGRVGRGSFRPPPKVDGAYVGLTLQEPPIARREIGAFIAMVRLAFGMRRKTLRNALAASSGKETASETVAALGRGDRVRAEELDLEAFLRLYSIWRKL